MEEKCDCITCRVNNLMFEEGIGDYVFFAHDGDRTYAAMDTENYRTGCLMRLCIDEIAEKDPELAGDIRDGLNTKPGLKVVH